MIVWTKSTWTDGKKTFTGKWTYIWHSDRFYIVLDKQEGDGFYVSGDHPEWGKFKRVEKGK